MTAEQRQRAERMVNQGDTYMAQANFAAARQFYRRAADIGLALGAMRLASTYDPVELVLHKVQGLSPDAAEARKWYNRARELGASDASIRISRLDGK